jgi:hypothetical protein
MDAVEQIKSLKARYFRFMDTKNWEGYQGLFTDDVVFDVRGGMEATKPDARYDEPPITGVEAVVNFIRTGLQHAVSIHQGFMPEIELTSPNSARGIWGMSDIIRAPEGAPFKVLRGYGHYHETYRLEQGHWKIASLRLTRLAVEIE